MLKIEVAAAGIAAMWEYFKANHGAIAITIEEDKSLRVHVRSDDFGKIPGEAHLDRVADKYDVFKKTVAGVGFIALFPRLSEGKTEERE